MQSLPDRAAGNSASCPTRRCSKSCRCPLCDVFRQQLCLLEAVWRHQHINVAFPTVRTPKILSSVKKKKAPSTNQLGLDLNGSVPHVLVLLGDTIRPITRRATWKITRPRLGESGSKRTRRLSIYCADTERKRSHSLAPYADRQT